MLKRRTVEVREYIQENIVGKMSSVRRGFIVVATNLWSYLSLHWIGRIAIRIRGRISLCYMKISISGLKPKYNQDILFNSPLELITQDEALDLMRTTTVKYRPTFLV